MRPFGKFRLVEHLASGGMADVWRAEMPGAAGFVKEIALKLVRGEHRQDDAFTRMFVQEARLASRLDHANVVHVFELGEVDGQFYIAMELVRGRTLRDVVDRCRDSGVRFGVPRAVHVCAEVARALAYAHRVEIDGRPAEVVHRDVSPQNVLISNEGEVKLADFGIARAAGADEHTRAGVIKGKLGYMAPEQARGEIVDGRADVFSLGVVLWELCAGRRLFAREGDAATLAAVLDGAPVSRASAWNEAVPAELDDVVAAALERDRERRIRSDELARRLAAVRARLASADPDDIDLRAFMLRLWPDRSSAPRDAPHERTAVMREPHVPVVAEAGNAASPPGPSAAAGRDPAREPRGADAPDLRDAPTRTLARPRPFAPHLQARRSLLLLVTVAFAIAFAIGVLRWATDAPGDAPGGPGAPPASGAAVGPPPGAATRGAGGEAAQPRNAAAPPESAATVQPPAAERAPARAGPSAGAAPPTPEPVRAGTAGAPPTPAAPAGAASRAPARGPAGSRSPATQSSGTRSTRAPAILEVEVLPWATIYVDDEPVGDTPLTLEVPSGAHRLRAVHPRLGTASARLRLEPGERRRWAPELAP